ncbi:YoaK family protein [Thaumasiovibrio subtropicus]|uniref:YoaK family protein n=1 Tax=Thaumasiovibrio subtropicus TaxID=1891207 RepID=UPI000B35BAAB|nr:YoaK family protein [Thaumasiovibrio subtropicus]
MLTRIPLWILLGAVLLAFSAGSINAIALLTFSNNAASHVTGTITQAMNSLVHDTASDSTTHYLLSIVGMFLLGAVTSGVIVKNEALRQGRRYGIALFIEAIALYAATYYFYQHRLTGELLASFACGLQNAMIATYSGSVIRTTHLTGIISDLGAAIGQRISGASVNGRQVIMQSAILVAFSLGAVSGALSLNALGLLAMLIPASIVLLAAVSYQFKVR